MTNKARLLIVDDELDLKIDRDESRRAYYSVLADKFDIFYVERPADLHNVLHRQQFDIVLIDFILDQWEMKAEDIIRKLDKRFPIALISQSWTLNFGALAHVVASFPIARLFSWDDMRTPQGQEIVRFWLNEALERHYGLVAFDREPNDPVRIVHFSDLQFDGRKPGAFHATDTQAALQKVQTRWSSPPDLIALTGDIAEAGRPIEYDMAAAWISKLRDKLGGGIHESVVLTVPGNHDVSWPLAVAPYVSAKDRAFVETAMAVELSRYSIQPYRDFSRKVEPVERWDNHRSYWVSGAYRRVGVILFGINSSEELDRNGLPTRRLTDTTIANLFDDLHRLRRDAPEALVVGLMHHPLAHSDEPIVNADAFRRALSAEIGSIVLLTGHVHTQGADLISSANMPRILQIGSSTFTLEARKRPEESLRGFTMIELQRKDGRIVGIEVHPMSIHNYAIQEGAVGRFQREPGGRITEE